ncbi:hypothetical protein ONZ45_g9972 [Pleurotus djamor]|nr:hypothetical protein ONZ45_g9972 [Pleurotus djamor]
MVDWMSPTVIAQNAVSFSRFMHCLLGLYIWEWFTSLDFDWQYISRKRKFRWPMGFYFANRYCLLLAAIALNVTEEIDCQSLYTFNSLVGNASSGLASINLSLRTMAVWSQNKFIVIPLVAIILGHWSLLLHGVLLKAVWVPEAGCVITETDNNILAITWIYSMSFDFLVLCLAAWKLAFPGNIAPRSRLVNLIFHDGLIYFVVAFLANLIAVIFMKLNLNPVMSIIANVPAAIVSTIVACRAVRRLNNYTNKGPEVFQSTNNGTTLAFRSGAQTANRPKVDTKSNSEGVHVQMETFESPSSYAEYDASGKLVKGDVYDPEAQIISDEFKRPPY